MMGILQLTQPQVLDDALVGSTCGEKRNEGQRHVDGHCKKNDSEVEDESFILKYLIDFQSFSKAHRLFS